MPKYWGKQISAHRRFFEVGQKQKMEKKREKDRKLVITMAKLHMAHASMHGARKPPGPKEKERAKVGDNNGQATHGARRHAWRMQATWAKRREKDKRRKTERW